MLVVLVVMVTILTTPTIRMVVMARTMAFM